MKFLIKNLHVGSYPIILLGVYLSLMLNIIIRISININCHNTINKKRAFFDKNAYIHETFCGKIKPFEGSILINDDQIL